MLGSSPLIVTYSYADNEGKEHQKNVLPLDKVQKERLWKIILYEKVVNGKLQVRHYALPEDVSSKDMQRMLPLREEMARWAYVNNWDYQAGIVLFDGKVSRMGENLWEISSNGAMNFGREQLEPGSGGKSNESQEIAYETDQNEEFRYRVIFSGKIPETNTDRIFNISFLNPSIKTPLILSNLQPIETVRL